MIDMMQRARALALVFGFTALAAPSSTAQGLWGGGDERVESKVAHFELNGALAEKPAGDMGLGLTPAATTLASLVERIQAADDDDEVRALLFTYRSPSFGLAQIQELRSALAKVDKPIYFHADSLQTGSYWLASAASHVSVTPTGDVWLTGMYSESPYVKGLLEKLHIKPDYVHIGDFKSAGEMYYSDGPSPPAEANMNWLLDGLFEAIVGGVADSRFGGNADRARAAIDVGAMTAEEALKAGLIDAVEHRQDVAKALKEQFGDDLRFASNYGADNGPSLDFGNPFGIFKLLADMRKGSESSGEDSIGVIHVNGVILPGSEEVNPLGATAGAYSTDVRLALDKAAADPSIKAVVLRVDSPGGSALASEIIYDAVARVRAAGKPVIASMGNVAASGGYYVSCGADRIYANPATITASIGVVGGKMVTSGMWDMLGVSWHEYKRGASADLMTTARPWTEGERQKIHDWMSGVYDDFKGHILEHREDKLTQPIEEMAGGRVFSGRQALELGLVDEMGTMADAVRKAAELARVGDYELRVLPKPPSLFDLFENTGGERSRPRVALAGELRSITARLAENTGPFAGWLAMLETLDPQRVQALRQAILGLDLVHRERVILMAPVFTVR